MKKNDSSDNLSIAEILLLIVLLLCYAGTICFMIMNYRALLILFFILHSSVSIVFLLVSHDRMARAALKQNDHASLQLEDELQMISQYTDEIAALKQERDSLLIEKEQLSTKCSGFEKEIFALNASLEEAQAQAPADNKPEALNHLLPQEETPVELNIIGAANAVIEEMAPYSRQAGIQVLLSSANSSLMVRADAAFIRILFRNIIDNSIKYMNRNGSLVITISNIGDDLFIVLKDNGEGLPTDETAHIFELNYQGSNRISGNGLGLTQAKAIVEYYGGTIYAKSESGKGMGIYIQLPTSSH